MDFSLASDQRKMKAAAIALWAVVVLALAACGGGGSGSTTTGGTGTMAGGDVAAGREVFISTDCGSCHTLEEAGTTGVVGPNLDTDLTGSVEASGAQLADHVRTAILDPDTWVMPRYSVGVMPPTYGTQLSETELDDLVAFIVDSAQ